MKKLSVFFIAICFVLVTAGCSKANGKFEFLIPKDYVGWVYIIYDQSEYPEIKKEDGVTTFRIGEDGILKTSNKDAFYGTSTDRYFYVDEKGNKVKELDQIEDIHNKGVGNKGEGGGVKNGVEYTTEALSTVESFFVGDKSLMKNYKEVYPEDEMEQTK
ncbi:DUF6843 domain-containing protein [Paenibacillus gallinarum]|uniref:DUF6843 domain-containing protein n=1 Tax=Paenibacillus gallinarum TaxID=2762232 RepID=A0ABR8T3U4_9BACL|nr:hypothetical protein [Paenibacillus gallinarum]MBD7970435.1 hypothetical protein [Paenibacillus gallinarum]